MIRTERLHYISIAGLWLLAAVTLLSIAAQNIVFVGMAAWLAWRIQGKLGFPTMPPVLRWAAPFLVLSLIASWLGENRAHSLETWRRWLLIFLALYAADALSSERPLRAVLGALLFFSGLWAAGAAALALWGPLQAFVSGENLASIAARWADMGEWRAVSGSGGYMVLGTGSMLLLCFFSGLAFEDARFRAALPLACMAALGIALFFTQTRSAWLGALGGLSLLVLRRPKWAAVAGAGAIVLVLLWPSNPVWSRLKQGLDMSQGSTRERVFMLRGAREMVRQNPWLGIGDSLESSEGREGAYLRTQRPHAGRWGFPLEAEHGHLHSIPSQIAVMYGLPALVLLLLFSLRLSLEAWRARLAASSLSRGAAWGIMAAWLAWWLNGSLEYNFGSTQSSFTLWLLWGLGLAAFKVKPE